MIIYDNDKKIPITNRWLTENFLQRDDLTFPDMMFSLHHKSLWYLSFTALNRCKSVLLSVLNEYKCFIITTEDNRVVLSDPDLWGWFKSFLMSDTIISKSCETRRVMIDKIGLHTYKRVLVSSFSSLILRSIFFYFYDFSFQLFCNNYIFYKIDFYEFYNWIYL